MKIGSQQYTWLKKNDTEGNCWQTRPSRPHPPCLTHHLFSRLCHLEWKMKVSQWRNKLGQFLNSRAVNQDCSHILWEKKRNTKTLYYSDLSPKHILKVSMSLSTIQPQKYSLDPSLLGDCTSTIQGSGCKTNSTPNHSLLASDSSLPPTHSLT